MDAAIKKRWTDALRSGEYKQGKYGLRDLGDYYCCLGVLCSVIDPDGWRRDKDKYRHLESGGLLPESVRRAAGMDTDQEGKACGWNDEEGKSFAEIADLIDQTY